MVFALTTATWPKSITVYQRTPSGTWHPIPHTLDVMREEDKGRECDLCLTRRLETHVIRDHFTISMWHLECFERELYDRRETGEWRLASITWGEPTSN